MEKEVIELYSLISCYTKKIELAKQKVDNLFLRYLSDPILSQKLRNAISDGDHPVFRSCVPSWVVKALSTTQKRKSI